MWRSTPAKTRWTLPFMKQMLWIVTNSSLPISICFLYITFVLLFQISSGGRHSCPVDVIGGWLVAQFLISKVTGEIRRSWLWWNSCTAVFEDW
jgi:hypothetical protein